jgi:hypothetical protein
MICKILLLIFCLSAVHSDLNSQIRPDILDILGLKDIATAYFLSANRPFFSVSPYLTEKKKIGLGAGLSFSKDVFDVSLSMNYGLSKRIELNADFSAFTQTYNFDGNKIKGVGDAVIAVKLKLHESDYFIHSFQTGLKIPIANKSKELGTGKVDFHFGAAQGFYFNNINYELTVEMNLLRRRDIIINRRVDSGLLQELLKQYDYKYEPELVISISPGYDISEKISFYTGFSFSRNTRLNYNTSTLFGGIGIGVSKKLGFSIGGSSGVGETGSWLISTGIYYQP